MVCKTFWGFQREIKSFTTFETEEEGSIDCKSQRSGGQEQNRVFWP